MLARARRRARRCSPSAFRRSPARQLFLHGAIGACRRIVSRVERRGLRARQPFRDPVGEGITPLLHAHTHEIAESALFLGGPLEANWRSCGHACAKARFTGGSRGGRTRHLPPRRRAIRSGSPRRSPPERSE